jgi:hypothetical protein
MNFSVSHTESEGIPLVPPEATHAKVPRTRIHLRRYENALVWDKYDKYGSNIMDHISMMSVISSSPDTRVMKTSCATQSLEGR